MELRSRRSRSTTPFTRLESLETEVHIGRANHVEKSYSKTTTSKRSTMIRSDDDTVTSMEEHTRPMTRRSTRHGNNLRSMYKTSDYSSEEGENEVSSTHISQNEKNQIIEDARAAANGSNEVSALELYRKSGRYWDVYPKTDWTYSHYSKDRVELAPGVVAMPNMSRRTIHSYSSIDRETNTDFSPRETRRELFTNSNSINSSSNSHYRIRTRQLIYTWFLTIFTMITNAFYYSVETQLWFYRKLHYLASELMVMDLWILSKKRNGGNKLARVMALCLIPLVLLGGLWSLMSFGSFVCQTYIKEEGVPTEKIIQRNEADQKEQADEISHFEPHYTEDRFSKLQEEIKLLKLDVSAAEESWKSDLLSLKSQNFHNYRLNRCCRLSMLDVENSVRRILSNLLNDVEFLKDQDGYNEYMRNVFLANQDLESRLSALTVNLNGTFEDLIADNNKVIMDKVADVIRMEMRDKIEADRKKIVDINLRRKDGGGLSEEEVLKIVKGVLAIYDADKTGLVDYALESAGGQILTTRCTENYRYGISVAAIFGIPLWSNVNSPRTIIQPDIQPGTCWAFANFPGMVVIELLGPVEIESFSLEHISRLLVPNGKIDSAPKEFDVYGLNSENDEHPVLLGSYVYDPEGEPLQFFTVQGPGGVFQMVELVVSSNHGNPKYTCLYRFRVHGRQHAQKR